MAEEINMNDDEDMEDTEMEENDESEKDEKETKDTHHKKWYKSAWFWIIFVAILVLGAALVWFFSVYRPTQNERKAQTDAEKALASDWSKIVRETDSLVEGADQADSTEDFASLSDDTEKVLDSVNSAEERFGNQDEIENGTYQEALESLTSYALALQAVLDKDFEKITTDDFEAVKELADASKDSVEEFQDETEYVDDSISIDFFNVHIDVKTLYDARVEAEKEADEAAKEAEEAAKKAQQEEEKAVLAAVDGFTKNLISGAMNKIVNFMTESFQKEFDFDSRQDDYYVPVSYRTIDKVKDNDSRYYVYGRMTQKVAEGEDQYSYDYNFTVVKDGEKWLVDLDQAPSR